MVEVQQKAFATVEEAETDDVVVGERCYRIEDYIPDEGNRAATGLALFDSELRHLVAIAIHVLEVEWQRRIRVMQQVAINATGWTVVEGRAVRAGLVGHASAAATEEAKLAIRVEASVTHPAAENLVAAVDPEGLVLRCAAEQSLDAVLELVGEHFVGVEQEDPVGSAFVDRRVLLSSMTFEGLDEDLCVVATSDLESAIGGEGIDDDDLVGEAHGVECAWKIGLLVHGDHGDGESHGG